MSQDSDNFKWEEEQGLNEYNFSNFKLILSDKIDDEFDINEKDKHEQTQCAEYLG